MPLQSLGLVKTSFLDYPGKIATVLFTHGCNLRCPWCHNPGLVVGEPPDGFVPRNAVLDHLRRRRGLVEGVVVTGGEPLWHQDLPLLLEEIRDLDYPIKLDTNGTFPERLSRLASGLVEFVAMDVKMDPGRYSSLGLPDSGRKVRASVRLIQEKFPRHEFRLTWAPRLNRRQDIPEISKILGEGERLVLTGFRPGITLDPGFSQTPPAQAELAGVADEFRARGVQVELRVRDQATGR